jgi:hypothetical protein
VTLKIVNITTVVMPLLCCILIGTYKQTFISKEVLVYSCRYLTILSTSIIAISLCVEKDKLYKIRIVYLIFFTTLSAFTMIAKVN